MPSGFFDALAGSEHLGLDIQTLTIKDTKFHEGKTFCLCTLMSFVVEGSRCNGRRSMAGYSGTPLPKKLGIKDNFRVGFVEVPTEVRKELKAALTTCRIVDDERTALDFAMVFTKSSSQLSKEFAGLTKRLAPAGMLWVGWPKKSSGIASDLDENKVREIGLAAGLVDVKVCAVTEVWSGLKFVRRVKDR